MIADRRRGKKAAMTPFYDAGIGRMGTTMATNNQSTAIAYIRARTKQTKSSLACAEASAYRTAKWDVSVTSAASGCRPSYFRR
ncbi:MAG: hypothetical protein DMG68_20630 [Acidobacteria bacterium]|nr:MAG: hypothetical protein DMG68_20630 [Acidobacteriota bacterium]